MHSRARELTNLSERYILQYCVSDFQCWEETIPDNHKVKQKTKQKSTEGCDISIDISISTSIRYEHKLVEVLDTRRCCCYM